MITVTKGFAKGGSISHFICTLEKFQVANLNKNLGVFYSIFFSSSDPKKSQVACQKVFHFGSKLQKDVPNHSLEHFLFSLIELRSIIWHLLLDI